jgi:hypothetical protein
MQKQFTVSPSQVSAFRANLAAHGVTLPAGDSGQFVDSEHDITFGYAYDGTTLTVTIIDKPWLYPASTIFNAMNEYIGNPGASS